MRRALLAALALGSLISGPSAHAMFLTVTSFDLHAFDASIPRALGYQDGSVVYLSEMGSITPQESSIRTQYENSGCYPF